MDKISEINFRLAEAEKELSELEAKKEQLLQYMDQLWEKRYYLLNNEIDESAPSDFLITELSSEQEKIALFRSLFRGREDVFPKRFESKKTKRRGYQPYCKNEWIKGLCSKPKIKCSNCNNRELIPVTNDVIKSHLLGSDLIKKSYGDFTIGVYPLLPDEAMLQNDTGVMAASTAFGKTIIGIYLISQRCVNTLILVHRKQLLDQWISRLKAFLEIPEDAIGQISGGKWTPTFKIDVATIQSLRKKGIVNDVVGQYGHLIIDECHIVPARSFEIVVRQCKALYITGLSATVIRKDGHHPIIFMNCGPVRYRVDDKKQAAQRPFHHKVFIRKTKFSLPTELLNKETLQIHEIYNAMIEDEERNQMIVTDVINAISRKRSPIVLTERIRHLEKLASMLSPHTRNLLILRGGMEEKQRRIVTEKLQSIQDDEERLIIATGRYLGEGFDDNRLDTLFLTLPVSWKGTIAQYAGRLHRLHKMKNEVLIFDYSDLELPMLEKMHKKRLSGYRSIGYEIDDTVIM